MKIILGLFLLGLIEHSLTGPHTEHGSRRHLNHGGPGTTKKVTKPKEKGLTYVEPVAVAIFKLPSAQEDDIDEKPHNYHNKKENLRYDEIVDTENHGRYNNYGPNKDYNQPKAYLGGYEQYPNSQYEQYPNFKYEQYPNIQYERYPHFTNGH